MNDTPRNLRRAFRPFAAAVLGLGGIVAVATADEAVPAEAIRFLDAKVRLGDLNDEAERGDIIVEIKLAGAGEIAGPRWITANTTGEQVIEVGSGDLAEADPEGATPGDVRWMVDESDCGAEQTYEIRLVMQAEGASGDLEAEPGDEEGFGGTSDEDFEVAEDVVLARTTVKVVVPESYCSALTGGSSE